MHCKASVINKPVWNPKVSLCCCPTWTFCHQMRRWWKLRDENYPVKFSPPAQPITNTLHLGLLFELSRQSWRRSQPEKSFSSGCLGNRQFASLSWTRAVKCCLNWLWFQSRWSEWELLLLRRNAGGWRLSWVCSPASSHGAQTCWGPQKLFLPSEHAFPLLPVPQYTVQP